MYSFPGESGTSAEVRGSLLAPGRQGRRKKLRVLEARTGFVPNRAPPSRQTRRAAQLPTIDGRGSALPKPIHMMRERLPFSQGEGNSFPKPIHSTNRRVR